LHKVWQTFGECGQRIALPLLTGSLALSKLPIAWRLGSIRQAIPSEYPPLITTLNAPRRSRTGCCLRATRWLAVLRNPQEGGWPGDNLLIAGVAEYPVQLSQEAW